MKKIFIRAGMSPLDNMEASEVILKNAIGNNSGNLIYAYSIFRALMLEDTEIVPNYYKVQPSKAEFINENYDSFVIPLADAFRTSFVGEMRNLTELVKKLTIPSVVVGVGLRLPFQENLDKEDMFKFKFNDDVKNFVKAVLDKSAMLGLRGEITGEYLKSLGFREEIDYTVIGCPSMYTFGRELEFRDTTLTSNSRICINNSILCENNVQDFIERSRLQIPDHYFLPQRIQEFRLLYTGAPYYHEQTNRNHYPCDMNADMYKNNRVRGFVNIPTWLDFIKESDFSFGSRLHGNITSILSGTKSLLIPHDSRMKELTEYHNLPHIWAKDINENTDIFELFAKTDFEQVKVGHGQRFDHFIDFLDKNGLEHIYKDGENPDVVPLDERMKSIDLQPPIETIANLSLEEMTNKWNNYYPTIDKKDEKDKKELRRLRQKVKSQDKEIADLKVKIKKVEQNQEVTIKKVLRKIKNKIQPKD